MSYPKKLLVNVAKEILLEEQRMAADHPWKNRSYISLPFYKRLEYLSKAERTLNVYKNLKRKEKKC